MLKHTTHVTNTEFARYLVREKWTPANDNKFQGIDGPSRSFKDRDGRLICIVGFNPTTGGRNLYTIKDI